MDMWWLTSGGVHGGKVVNMLWLSSGDVVAKW